MQRQARLVTHSPTGTGRRSWQHSHSTRTTSWLPAVMRCGSACGSTHRREISGHSGRSATNGPLLADLLLAQRWHTTLPRANDFAGISRSSPQHGQATRTGALLPRVMDSGGRASRQQPACARHPSLSVRGTPLLTMPARSACRLASPPGRQFERKACWERARRPDPERRDVDQSDFWRLEARLRAAALSREIRLRKPPNPTRGLANLQVKGGAEIHTSRATRFSPAVVVRGGQWGTETPLAAHWGGQARGPRRAASPTGCPARCG